MTDETEQQEAVEETQETPEDSLPLDDQKSDAPVTTEEDTQTEEDLPEGVKERTRKRFEKLTEKLREKKEEPVERRSVFDEFRKPKKAPQAPYQPQPFSVQNFVSDDGTVDTEGMNRALHQAQLAGQVSLQQAQALHEQVQEMRFTMQEQVAFAKHPELDYEGEGYDSDFRDLVTDRMARYMAQGKEVPLVKVADEVRRIYAKAKTETKVAKEAVEQYQKAQERRQEVPIEAGKGQRKDTEDIGELKRAMREGDMETRAAALGRRLKSLGM